LVEACTIKKNEAGDDNDWQVFVSLMKQYYADLAARMTCNSEFFLKILKHTKTTKTIITILDCHFISYYVLAPHERKMMAMYPTCIYQYIIALLSYC